MDFVQAKYCIFPQIVYLPEMYEAAPNAIWILPFRNVSSWVRSISNWTDRSIKTIRKRMEEWCTFPELNFTGGKKWRKREKTDAEFEALYCNHVHHVRNFVTNHPSLSLIEYRIEDENVGKLLSKHIPNLDQEKWEQRNINSKQTRKKG